MRSASTVAGVFGKLLLNLEYRFDTQCFRLWRRSFHTSNAWNFLSTCKILCSTYIFTVTR